MRNFLKKWWKILLPSGVVAIAAVAALIVFSAIAPAFAAASAVGNLRDEARQRLETTPLRAGTILWETLDDGRMTVDFDIRDRRLFGLGVNGVATLMSDRQNNEYALEGLVRALWISVDLDVHLNSERLAARSQLLSRDFYGIAFNTFREDVRPFGGLAGLEDDTMDMLADWVDALAEFLKVTEEPAAHLEPYTGILRSFVLGLNFSTSRRNIISGGEQVTASRFEVTIAERDIFELLRNAVAVLESDENLRETFSTFENPTFELGGGSASHNELIQDLRYAISELERRFSGSIVVALYMGEGGRLLRVDMHVDMAHGYEPVELIAELDLGSCAYDLWSLNLTAIDSYGINNMRFDWSLSQGPNGYENTLSASFIDDGRIFEDTFTLSSVWLPESGSFTMSFTDVWDTASVGGLFALTPGGFNLRLDDLSVGESQTLTLEVSVERGADIPSIEYTNIDRWDRVLIDRATGIFRDLLFFFV
ncbi:MAG: hypothetical protein FWB97_06630 [Oscillospiraceae bacterium]|nr:hypothetical protein [Oscillospiraceae bacterium]